jgi:hypothetical protein
MKLTDVYAVIAVALLCLAVGVVVLYSLLASVRVLP